MCVWMVVCLWVLALSQIGDPVQGVPHLSNGSWDRLSNFTGSYGNFALSFLFSIKTWFCVKTLGEKTRKHDITYTQLFSSDTTQNYTCRLMQYDESLHPLGKTAAFPPSRDCFIKTSIFLYVSLKRSRPNLMCYTPTIILLEHYLNHNLINLTYLTTYLSRISSALVSSCGKGSVAPKQPGHWSVNILQWKWLPAKKEVNVTVGYLYTFLYTLLYL